MKKTLSMYKAIALFAILTLISCKKENFAPKSPAPEKLDSRVKNIPYSQFINAIDLRNTGSLRAVLSGEKEKIMSTDAGSGILKIEMDSVKRVQLGDTVSYVLAIKPQLNGQQFFKTLPYRF